MPSRKITAHRLPGARYLLGACALLACAPGRAIDGMNLSVERFAQAGIEARGIELALRIPDARTLSATLRIATAHVGADAGIVRNLVVQCPALIAQDFLYRCEDAHIAGRFAEAGLQSLRGRLEWNQRLRRLRFAAAGLTLAGGQLNLEGEWRAAGWNLRVNGSALGLAPLRQLLGKRLPALPSLSIDGRLAMLSAQASGGAQLAALTAEVRLEGVSLGNPDGSIATDQIAAHLTLKGTRQAGRWRFESELNCEHGEALAGRWYWNFTQQPLTASMNGRVDSQGIQLDQARWQLGTFMRAAGRAEFALSGKTPIHSLALDIADLDMAALPTQTRDGLLAGSPVPQLQGSGHVQGHLEIENDAPTIADLTFAKLALEDRRAGPAVDALSGRIRWQSLAQRKQALADSQDTQSVLSWKAGLLYGVRVGAARLQFTTASSDVRLLQGTRIPILDGGLEVRVLQLRRIGDPAMAIRFDATLDPISVAELCKAFGWPQFSGTLSGRIPDLALEAGVLTLGGALQAAVFDGTLRVQDLRLSDAFGARPRLDANVEFSRLDLAAITSAFDVGRITGRLDGRIGGLELVGWEPVAFDAHLYSTPGDRSRRRISQRAVQNISSIGGGIGATAALQRSALRFFHEFSYARIGISCRLKNDVCLMDGVEPHPPGYYLVKGWGLPRIDVIGNSRRVDWPQLLATLKELPESQATVGKSP